MTGDIIWFRYVIFADIPAYLALGWEWDGKPLQLHDVMCGKKSSELRIKIRLKTKKEL